VLVIENAIHVEPFTATTFTETVKQAGGGIVTRQVEYLASYLQTLKVATVVRETRYIDRHFMDEYALFYSRMLNPPKDTVTRLLSVSALIDGAASTFFDGSRSRSCVHPRKPEQER
jgi:hypothetical protein